MTKQAVEALRLIHDQVESVVAQLGDDEWTLPSACEGWRVQEVLAHMSSNMKEMVDPTEPAAEPDPNVKAEDMVEMLVTPRRDWTADDLLTEYRTYLDGWLGGLTAMQADPIASAVIPLADLGDYESHLLANAYAFDHYCHLYIDLLGPDGPLDVALPEATDDMVRPGIDWMIAGVPQMQPDEMRSTVTGPLRLDLTGPGGGSWLISPAADGGLVDVSESAGESVATMTSSAHDFVSWGTQRTSWRDSVTISGDESAAEPFLDALNII